MKMISDEGQSGDESMYARNVILLDDDLFLASVVNVRCVDVQYLGMYAAHFGSYKFYLASPILFRLHSIWAWKTSQ